MAAQHFMVGGVKDMVCVDKEWEFVSYCPSHSPKGRREKKTESVINCEYTKQETSQQR